MLCYAAAAGTAGERAASPQAVFVGPVMMILIVVKQEEESLPKHFGQFSLYVPGIWMAYVLEIWMPYDVETLTFSLSLEGATAATALKDLRSKKFAAVAIERTYFWLESPRRL